MTKVKIAAASDISTDKVSKTTANGQTILVAKVGDGYCAIANKCPHLGLPMSKGTLENGILTCPFHGSKFEMCTGKNVEWVETFVGIPLPGAAKKLWPWASLLLMLLASLSRKKVKTSSQKRKQYLFAKVFLSKIFLYRGRADSHSGAARYIPHRHQC